MVPKHNKTPSRGCYIGDGSHLIWGIYNSMMLLIKSSHHHVKADTFEGKENTGIKPKKIYLQLWHQKHWTHHRSFHSQCVKHADSATNTHRRYTQWKLNKQVQTAGIREFRQRGLPKIKVFRGTLIYLAQKQHQDICFLLPLLSILYDPENYPAVHKLDRGVLTGTTWICEQCKRSISIQKACLRLKVCGEFALRKT